MNILIVEDEAPVAEAINAGIVDRGYSVENAGSGKDAVNKIRQKRFDLVLLDIFLPDCKGYELIPEFRKLRPDIRIVTMTGHNCRELELKVRQLGIVYYMIKPFSMKEIKEILNHIGSSLQQAAGNLRL